MPGSNLLYLHSYRDSKVCRVLMNLFGVGGSMCLNHPEQVHNTLHQHNLQNVTLYLPLLWCDIRLTQCSIRMRLLHPGVNTADIITQYVAAIKV